MISELEDGVAYWLHAAELWNVEPIDRAPQCRRDLRFHVQHRATIRENAALMSLCEQQRWLDLALSTQVSTSDYPAAGVPARTVAYFGALARPLCPYCVVFCAFTNCRNSTRRPAVLNHTARDDLSARVFS